MTLATLQSRQNHRTLNELELFACITCHGPVHAEDSALSCSSCRLRFPFLNGILDTLVQPDPEAVREMQGMAREMGVPLDQWETIKVRLIEKSPELHELKERTANDPNSYYDQTWASFEQALRVIDGQKLGRVLEVGSGVGFHYLRAFHARGALCYALNLRFDLPKTGDDTPWLVKTIGDMNALPYANETFDVILLSATSHHSPNLAKTVSETARVLKPGGVALYLNDQISGWFKFVNTHTHGRDGLIHENYYSIKKYHANFVKNGLKPQYLFSDFYDQKLMSGKISSGLRFARVGKLLALPWRNRFFRSFAKSTLLWPAHRVFGFPLNVVLWKPRR